MQLTYLNNAATSFPKPPVVRRAVAASLEVPPVEPGRVGVGLDPLDACRAALAALFGVDAPERVALTPSCTHALNLVVLGMLAGGGHAVYSALEHNSVLRPLEQLRRAGRIDISQLPADGDGRVEIDQLSQLLRPGQTKLVVLTHASNVTGAIQAVEQAAEIAAAADVPLLIDAAQSAGALALQHRALPGRVFVALAGHKGLLGPSGTGALLLPDGELPQLLVGGTGVQSERLEHPGELPLRHEAGTPNTAGIAGLAAGVAYVAERGVAALGDHRAALVSQARQALGEIATVQLAPLPDEDGRAGVVSLTVAGHEPAELCFTLREAFAIETRAGLHCAPLTHAALARGSGPGGNLRVSFGPFNDAADVERLVVALSAISRGATCSA